MNSRQFPSYEEAESYLKERGKLEYFGRAGREYEYCVYNLHLPSGYVYHVDLYDNGKVVVYPYGERGK